MAREHWAYARDHMDDMKKNLMHQFRRIEVNESDIDFLELYLSDIVAISSTSTTSYDPIHA